MSYEIRLYVPEATGKVEYVKRRMAQECGGFTAYHADGGWVNNDGELIEEPVTVISGLTGARPSARAFAQGLARELADTTDEEAVLWEITHSNYGLES